MCTLNRTIKPYYMPTFPPWPYCNQPLGSALAPSIKETSPEALACLYEIHTCMGSLKGVKLAVFLFLVYFKGCIFKRN